MNPCFQHIIIEHLKKHPPKHSPKGMSKAALLKEARSIEVRVFHTIKEIMLIVIGVLIAGFGLKGFLLPNGFIDGGVTGISLLVAEVTSLPLPILLVFINAPFIMMGFSQIGKPFGIKSIFALSFLALAVAFIEYPLITDDKLLIAVFGGFFLGAGIGLAVRGGAVLDGTEVLAVFLNKKTGLTIGDVILIFNIMIFSLAALLLSIEVALYAILTYLAGSKTVDFIVEGVEEYLGVRSISPEHEEIRLMILNKMGRGVTIYRGQGGYGSLSQVDIIYTVITRLELAKLKRNIDVIDSKAFIVMSSVQGIKGGVIKKRPLTH